MIACPMIRTHRLFLERDWDYSGGSCSGSILRIPEIREHLWPKTHYTFLMVGCAPLRLRSSQLKPVAVIITVRWAHRYSFSATAPTSKIIRKRQCGSVQSRKYSFLGILCASRRLLSVQYGDHQNVWRNVLALLPFLSIPEPGEIISDWWVL